MPPKTAPQPVPAPRMPGFFSFALAQFAVSCLMSLALDLGPVLESPDFVGGLVGNAFPGLLVALAAAAISFHDPKGRRGLLWRAAPPAVLFGLERAMQFALGLAPAMPDGKPPLDLSIAGGVGVFLVGAGLTVLALFGARRFLAALDRRRAGLAPAAAAYVGDFRLFAAVMTVMALALTQLLVGPALPPPHLFNLAQTAALPLGVCLIVGTLGFWRAGPERSFGRRMTPGLVAYCVVWLGRGVLTIAVLGGGIWQMLLGALSGLAISFLIAMLSAFALYGARALVRLYLTRRAA